MNDTESTTTPNATETRSLLLEAANELGNTLHKFDTAIEALRQAMKVADPRFDSRDHLKQMADTANPARTTLKKLNAHLDSPSP